MGKYDSSEYRIAPLVKAIMSDEKSFASFLKSVHTEKEIPNIAYPAESKAYFYGNNEKKLKPTKAHLKGLVKYIASKKCDDFPMASGKRAYLYGKSTSEDREKTKSEALLLIDSVYERTELPSAWYIFEGATCPDIYIEGEDCVIICEGKWTERHITEKTTHLRLKNEYRSQMVRHIQGALNFTSKRVIAFYIVDAECGYLNDLTEAAFENQLKKETIAPPEADKIITAFYGYTTWQELESVIPNLKFQTKEEIDKLNKEGVSAEIKMPMR